MKCITKLFFFVFVTKFTFGQSSLDSLRLVLPIGHSKKVNSATFSPDGKYAITSSDDNTARIFDVASGKLICILKGHEDRVTSAIFSPNGKLILTTSWDGTARTWDAFSGELLKVIYRKDIKCSHSVAFSVNSKLIIAASFKDSTARIYDSSNGNTIQVIKEHLDEVETAVFSIDNKYALTTNANIAYIYNVKSGELINTFKCYDYGLTSANFSTDGKLVLTLGDYGTIQIWEVSTGFEIKKIVGDYKSANFSNDGNRFIAVGDSSARIWEVSKGDSFQELKHTDFVWSAYFSSDGKYALTASSDGTACAWNADTGEKLLTLYSHKEGVKTAIFSKNDKLIITSPKNGFFSNNDHFASIYNFSTGNKIHDLKGKAEVDPLAISGFNGKLAIFSTTNAFNLAEYPAVRIWDVQNVKQIHVINDSGYHALISDDGKTAITINRDSIQPINVYDISSDIFIPLPQSRNEFLFVTNCTLALTKIDDEKIVIWNCVEGKEMSRLSVSIGEVNYAVFSPDNNYLLIEKKAGNLLLLNVATGKVQRKLKHYNSDIRYAIFSPDSKLILTACSTDSTLRIYNVSTGNLLKFFTVNLGDFQSATFSTDGKYILGYYFNEIKLWDISSGKELNFMAGELKNVNAAFFSTTKNQIFTSQDDHKSILWNLDTDKPIYELIPLQKDNWLVKLPNSPYYMCSKDASKMLHYVTPSLKVIGFEQLDPVYNRPDIVLDCIGKFFGGADQELVANYRQSWEKRIDLLGLDKEKLGKGEIAVPSAEIIGADEIAYENNEGKVEIKVEGIDSKYTLRRFNVYVNEVPIYGSLGISISQLNTHQWDTTLTIPLSYGENKIQVSVMNELGLENFKYPTYVNYNPVNDAVFAKTHYIGIGVNSFINKQYNLTYCVKDVNDLASALGGENTRVKILTDQQVTRENILQLKQYLKDSTTVNDKVIISCSSHGLLDDSLNFYLATHDVDFKHPELRGLRYEELESLLDGIPARQKLLLLDACNSGENDKTELLTNELAQKESKMNVASDKGPRGVTIQSEEDSKNVFIKMNELFVNVRNNTGSVIISAAGGRQSALEGDAVEVNGKKIENGAFTYSVLEYLKSNEGNQDALTVNKLKQYVENRVEELTEGKQKPTSRQETMEVDWGVR